jgi:hypothetical protein
MQQASKGLHTISDVAKSYFRSGVTDTDVAKSYFRSGSSDTEVSESWISIPTLLFR